MKVSSTYDDHIDGLDDSSELVAAPVISHAQLSDIFQQHWERLYRLAYHLLKDDDDAQDVVQEVFISFWDRRFELQIQTSIASYLYGSVRYKSITRLQTTLNHKKRNVPLEDALVESFVEAVDPLLLQELQQEIDNHVQRLPVKMRQVFYMRTVECLSVAQIAHQLSISEATVKNHLAAARKKLRSQLSDAAYLGIALVIGNL